MGGTEFTEDPELDLDRLEEARAYFAQDDTLFWSWLAASRPQADYDAMRAQPLNFIRQLNADAWDQYTFTEAFRIEVEFSSLDRHEADPFADYERLDARRLQLRDRPLAGLMLDSV